MKILDYYDKTANYLASFGSDKYLHFIIGIILSYLLALLFSLTNPGFHVAAYMFAGFLGNGLCMLAKEIADFFREGMFDGKDIVFGILGGVLGSLLFI